MNDSDLSARDNVMSLDNYRRAAKGNLVVFVLLMITAIGLSVSEVVLDTPVVPNAVEWAVACFFAAGYFIANYETIKRLVAEIERLRAGKEEGRE